MKRTDTDFIVVHCSASMPLGTITARTIRGWHTSKGWSDIGYHYVIRTTGQVEAGRAEDAVGAHVAGYNSRSVGICMVGGVDREGHSLNNFTRNQFTALRRLVGELKERYPSAVVLGHRDFKGVKKDCPCFDVGKWWASNNGD